MRKCPTLLGIRTQEPAYWHHPIEDIEPIVESAASNAAKATAKLFDSVVGETFRSTGRPAQDATPLFRRFLALLWVLDPVRYFEGRNETQVADYLGITRSAFSALVCEYKQRLGLRNRMMKREGAVGVYSARQERIWRERRKAEPDAQLYLNVAYQ